MSKAFDGPAGLALRLLYFLSPLVLVVMVAEAVLWRVGDARPVSHVVRQRRESSEEVLYARGFFSQQYDLLKIEEIRLGKPSILVLGSSRVLQVRREMFVPLDSVFYNAGGLIDNAPDLLAVAEQMETGHLWRPRVVILGLDPWWIKEGWFRSLSRIAHRQDEVYNPTAHIVAIRALLRDPRNLRRGFSGSARTPYFGYRAIGSPPASQGRGFRKDGSYQYSPQMLIDFIATPQYVDRETPPVIRRVREFRNQFEVPARVDPISVDLMVQAIQKFRNMNIEIHVVTPPFSTEVLDAVNRTPEFAAWWGYYRDSLPERFGHWVASVVAVSSPATWGLDDTYMVDGFHPSEVIIGHIVREMLAGARGSSVLASVDVEQLSDLIAGAALPLAFKAPQ